ncbi:hypothetical protein BASA81_003001 [Batrachochytrium salamandrivorans]|nr:hypothetical protein BASA81_003001 [Batrachochytrium salamandrivorans]
MLGNEEAGHVHIHPKLPLTLVGFKSGRVSLFNASQEQVFSHHVLELKSVLFADEHTLRESGLGRPSTTTPIATATVTTMIAVCAKQICTFDSIHTSLVRITPELDGASLTGAVLQLDADHFILGTSLGSLVLYSLGQRSIIKFAQATMNIHKRPISSMVAVSPTSLVVGCVGSAFLSVWDLVRGNNNKSNNNSSSSFALSHSRRIVLYTGKANVPAAMEVLELRFDPTAKLLACKLGAQSTVIWDMAAAATERLVHRVSGLVELPLNLNHCHHLSVLVIRDGKLVSALPQSSARNLAAGLENSVVLSETKFTGGGKLSLLPNNPDQEELAIPIRVVVPHLGQHKITRFWQHPHQPDCYLVQCSDHTLRFTQVSRPPVAPSSFAGERLYLKDNTLVYRSQRDATMAHLYPALHSDPEEFLRHKDHLLKIAETGALTEEDCAAAEALWPGRIDLQLCSSDGKHKDFLLASWREAGQFALITNLSPLGGEGVVTTLLAGACTAVGFAAREGGEVGVLVARRKLERSAPSSLPSSSVDAPPSTSMFRRGSMTFNSNANMSSFRKRLSLPVNSASAAAATAAAEKKPSTFVLAVYQVSADHAQVSHEVDVGSGGKPWTKFFQLNKEDGKLTLVPGSPTLPRHILAATWQRADDGVTMAFTWEVHLAFVGLALRTNEPSWVLAANKKRCCVARVERERVVLVDADTGVELEPTVSLASPLIKTGMLASAGFGQSAQRWAQSLGTELDKNVAVGLLQRLGFPLRAAGVVGASPHVLLDLMLEHESCRTQALQVFHPPPARLCSAHPPITGIRAGKRARGCRTARVAVCQHEAPGRGGLGRGRPPRKLHTTKVLQGLS